MLCAQSQPHLLHLGSNRGTIGDTVTHKATIRDILGRSWLLQSSDKASGRGGAARMQTNSSCKVQAVPGADGSTDSSGSLPQPLPSHINH